MEPFPWRLITVDIDGTLTRGHGWRPIAVAFGKLSVLEESNRRFYAREIGEDEHLTNILRIATGHTVAEVETLVDRTPKLDGIAEGLRELHARGARVALLTHNPSYVTQYYRRTFGFDDEEGVDAQAVTDGLIGPPVGVHADKPAGLALLLARADVPPSRTVHIGDGWSDALVFRRVGGRVALNSSLPEVRAAADLALSTEDFRAVVTALDRLTPPTAGPTASTEPLTKGIAPFGPYSYDRSDRR